MTVIVMVFETCILSNIRQKPTKAYPVTVCLFAPYKYSHLFTF